MWCVSVLSIGVECSGGTYSVGSDGIIQQYEYRWGV
jgi:hypothetical protein